MKRIWRFGVSGKSSLPIIVERKTRYLFARKIKNINSADVDTIYYIIEKEYKIKKI